MIFTMADRSVNFSKNTFIKSTGFCTIALRSLHCLYDWLFTENIIEYNLAVFVKPSTSLLNDDVTPAAFWITHPTNYVRHNHAAGGSHFAFW